MILWDRFNSFIFRNSTMNGPVFLIFRDKTEKKQSYLNRYFCDKRGQKHKPNEIRQKQRKYRDLARKYPENSPFWPILADFGRIFADLGRYFADFEHKEPYPRCFGFGAVLGGIMENNSETHKNRNPAIYWSLLFRIWKGPNTSAKPSEQMDWDYSHQSSVFPLW